MSERDYPDRPIVGVGAVVFKDDAVLLIRRARPPRAGRWSLPGGAQELGETWVACAHREIAEETGLEIELIGIVDVVDAITRDDAGRVLRHYTLVDVAAEWRAGEPVAGDDAADARWVPRAELGGYALWSETVRIIEAAAALRAAAG